MSEKLRIWAVSDGRAGMENQALGLAEAIARRVESEITLKRVRWRRPVGRLPTAVLALLARPRLTVDSDPLEPPWPHLWIAAGRATIPLSIRMRKWSEGRTFVVQTQDPRLPARLFDLVIPPRHDGLEGDRVFSVLGSPHRVTPERLALDEHGLAARLKGLPGPRAAVLIGGRSRAYGLPLSQATALADLLVPALEASGGSVMATFSRRTPDPAKALLTARLSPLPGMVWSGVGDNPYFDFLAAADVVLVTEDSINMAAEAASTGKPVYILEMAGRGSARIRRFHRELELMGASRPFEGALERWTYEPLRETERAAEEVLRRLAARA